MPTHDEIKQEAHAISQRKKATGNPEWKDAYKNWVEAIGFITQRDRFNYEKWARG